MYIIWVLMRKEFRQIFRDSAMSRIIFIVPLVQLMLLGHVVTTDVKNLPVGILDYDHTRSSRTLASKIFAASYFVEYPAPDTPEQLTDLIARGDITAGVIIEQGLDKRLGRGEAAGILIMIDGTDANSARVALGYLSAIVQDFSKQIMIEQLVLNPGSATLRQVVNLNSTVLYNPDLESTNYMIPGIIAIIITVLTSVLTSMAVVREREIGTLEQIMVTPIKPYQLLLGKTIPFTVLCFIVTGIALALGKAYFQFPIRGNLVLFFLFVLLFLLTCLGLGLLISTISHTQQQALFLTWFINIFAIIMSNFFIPIHNMPKVIQYLTYLNPVRYFLAIVRDLFLKGSGLETLWPDALALACFGVVIFTVSVLRFNKRLA